MKKNYKNKNEKKECNNTIVYSGVQFKCNKIILRLFEGGVVFQREIAVQWCSEQRKQVLFFIQNTLSCEGRKLRK